MKLETKIGVTIMQKTSFVFNHKHILIF